MRPSKLIHQSLLNALTFADCDQIAEFLNEGGRIMDYFPLTEDLGEIESDPHGVELAFMAGAQAESDARDKGVSAFCAEFDGNGIWVFYSPTESAAVAALQRAAAKFAEDQAAGERPEA